MKITKATFDCTIAMPGYNNIKPGASEIVLEPGETIEDAWSELNRRAIAWHKKEYPHLYEDRIHPPLKMELESKGRGWTPDNTQSIPVIPKEKEPVLDNLSAIQSATTLEELKSYKFLAANDKELYAAYNKKVKELALKTQ